MKSRLTLVSAAMLVALLFSFVPLAGMTIQSVAAATFCDAAAFVADVTVPDGTVFAPGATFKKTWRLINIGTCTWTTAYSLVFVSGVQMGTVTAVMLPSNVAPSQTVDVSVDMTAPYTAGEYRGNWQLANASGEKFGGVFWVEIVVSNGVTLTLRSTGTYDGWVLESTEFSNKGGTLNRIATTFYLGDNAQDKQYRAILHFNTSTLPDNAVITKVTLKIKKQGVVGTNPFTILGRLKADIRKPFFGTLPGLQVTDFQAAANKVFVGTFTINPVNNWYIAVIGSAGYPYINKTGTTQFRLRFYKDDNDDGGADYMKFYSGNYLYTASRPTLIIEYYVP